MARDTLNGTDNELDLQDNISYDIETVESNINFQDTTPQNIEFCDDSGQIQNNFVFDIDFIDDNNFDFSLSDSSSIPFRAISYNELGDKPQIDSVTLQGDIDISNFNLKHIYYMTTEQWNSTPSLISEEGAVYIYSDYFSFDDEYIPGIKIGDGLAYVVDLPFLDEGLGNLLLQHINNSTIHTNSTEKTYWNNKISIKVDEQDEENIVFFQ